MGRGSNRTINKSKTPPVKPVQKIQLEDKNNKLKLIFVVIFLVIGISCIGYGIWQALSKPVGWTQIEANSSSEGNCSDEFVLLYNLGVSGVSATAENKALITVYTKATEHAYQLFNCDVAFEGVNNIYYINQHPNEEIIVDEVLYQAFQLLEDYENRNIYLGPTYMYYDDMFYCQDDSEAEFYDPFVDADAALYYSEISKFAADANAVNVELLGNNTIRLNVSEEYLSYAKENFVTRYIDFFWMKNAFIIDYLGDELSSQGFTKGTLSSFDGFNRSLVKDETEFSYNVYNKNEKGIYIAATMKYKGGQNMVMLRDYKLYSKDIQHYYQYKDGTTRTSYFEVEDGMPKSAIDTLLGYSKEHSCAQILLEMIPVYVSDEFNQDELKELVEKQVNYVYCNDFTIYHSDKEIVLTEIYNLNGVSYDTKEE